MDENNLHSLMAKCLSEDSINKCIIEYNEKYTSNFMSDLESVDILNKDDINCLQMSKDITCISGIYIPVFDSTKSKALNIIEVESTRNNLRKVAIGIAANRAVSLQGPVGCGKTTSVEYLACKTGRVLGENFIKVQLGDQTDSKILLGTYRCTDIPGEFIWSPGVLTQVCLLIKTVLNQ